MECFGEPYDSDDPEKFWTDFMSKVLKVYDCCLRDASGASKRFLTKETPNIIVKSRRASLEGNIGHYGS